MKLIGKRKVYMTGKHLFRITAILLPLIFTVTQGQNISTKALNYQYMPIENGIPTDTLSSLEIISAVDESETAALNIHANEKIGKCSISIGAFKSANGKRTLNSSLFNLAIAEFVPLDSSGKERTALRVLSLRDTSIEKGKNLCCYITFRSENLSDSGVYYGKIEVKADKIKHSIKMRINVLPFRLLMPDNMRFIICVRGGIKSREFLKLIKKTGFDGFELYVNKPSGFAIESDKGKQVVKLGSIDTVMRDATAAGMRGPMFVMLGNDRMAHIEDRICGAFPQFKMTTSPKIGGKQKKYGPIGVPEFDSLYLDAFAVLKNGIEKYGIEMVPVIFDEVMERFFPELPARDALIRSRFPKIRMSNTAQGDFQWTREVAPYSEVIISNSELEPTAFLCRKTGKSFWINTFIGSGYAPGKARGYFGMRHWKYSPEALVLWSADCYGKNPWIDYDDDFKESKESLLFPPREGTNGYPTESPAWYGVREGIDDLAYVTMLEKLAVKHNKSADYPINDMKHAIGDYEFHDTHEGFHKDYSAMDSVRCVAARGIVELLKLEKKR